MWFAGDGTSEEAKKAASETSITGRGRANVPQIDGGAMADIMGGGYYGGDAAVKSARGAAPSTVRKDNGDILSHNVAPTVHDPSGRGKKKQELTHGIASGGPQSVYELEVAQHAYAERRASAAAFAARSRHTGGVFGDVSPRASYVEAKEADAGGDDMSAIMYGAAGGGDPTTGIAAKVGAENPSYVRMEDNYLEGLVAAEANKKRHQGSGIF